MEHKTYLEIIAILVLILANGFFSLSEFSMVASRRSRLRQLMKKNYRHAHLALKIINQPENFLATVQLGITFIGVLAGVFSGMTIVNSLIPILTDWGVDPQTARTIVFVFTVVIISLLTVVIGELVPKYLALARPERIASSVALPMIWFSRISYVVVKFMTIVAKLFLRLFGMKRIPERASVTEDEINMIIAEGREKGLFDATEQQIIHSVFDFSDTTARKAMTPRTDIIGINIEEKTEKVLRIVTRHGFSRYPVYEESLDNIVGLIYTKDIIKILMHSRLIAVKDIFRKPLYVPDSMKLNQLLEKFQQKKVHAAIVLDEFGGTAGLITLEDLIEEIVGEIQDEHDIEQREFVCESDTVAFASASYRVDELNDSFNTALPEDDADTLGGFVFNRVDHVLSKGEEIKIGSLLFTVLEVQGNRLKRFRIEKIQLSPKK